MEHQDSIVRGQMAFAIRRSLRKAASHRAASYHLDRGTNRQVLVQRQGALNDPLLDQTGKRMKWLRRMPPKASR